MKSIFIKGNKSIRWIISILIVGAIFWHFLSPLQFHNPNTKHRTADDILGSEPFRLIDQFSVAHALINYRNKKSIFLIYIDETCRSIASKEYDTLVPAKNGSITLFVTNDYKSDRKAYEHIRLPVLFDDLDFLIKAYGLKNIGDYVEISPQSGAIISQGKTAFNSFFTNFCGLGSANNTPNFDSVKNIFSQQCLQCHMQKEGLDYFTDVNSIQKWSKMMMKTMETYRMPPGGYDTSLKYRLQGYLRHKDMRPIYKWLASGAPMSVEDEASLLALRKDINLNSEISKFKNRKPDLVLKSKVTDKVPASGDDFEVYHGIGDRLKEDTYFEAAHYSHNQNVVHHSMLYKVDRNTIKYPETGTYKMFHTENQKNEYIDAYANGKKVVGLSGQLGLVFGYSNNRDSNYIILRNNSAQFVPKGSKLILSNHYFPWGSEQYNNSTISLYKYKGDKPPKKLKEKMFLVRDFVIKPNESDYVIHSIYPVKKNITLFLVRTHLHMRGRDVKVHIKRANGEKELLMSVPFYLYKHNMPINFAEPVFIEKGAELHFHVRYDNTDLNPANPDPSQKLRAGLSILDDEMYLLIMVYAEEQDTDKGV